MNLPTIGLQPWQDRHGRRLPKPAYAWAGIGRIIPVMTEIDPPEKAPMALERLIDTLQATARRPRNEAWSLPPSAYTSPELLDLEIQRLFRSGWICIGRTQEIPEPGSFVTFEIAGSPIIAIRQKNGSIRAFSNVCLHRASRLMKAERGRTNRIVCPYHAWTYNSEGTLCSAPYMEHTAGFSKIERHLPEIRTDCWEGFIYVALDPNVEPVSGKLTVLTEIFGQFKIDRYITFTHDTEIWDANWKVLVENFIEGYHLFKIHPQTFEPVSKTAWQEPQVGGEAFMYLTSPIAADSAYGVAPPGDTRLAPEWRAKGAVICVYPAHLIQITADFLWYMSLQPAGVGRLKVRRGLSVAPERLALEKDHAAFFAESLALFDKVNVEDKVAIEAVQAGMGSVLARQSPLCIYESCIHDFSKYLASNLRLSV